MSVPNGLMRVACVALALACSWPASALTILPLGDSLTYGQGSNATFSNSLGYRLPLQRLLWNEGITYDMIGGLSAGSFSTFDPTPGEPTVYTGPSATLTNGLGNSRPLDLDHFGWPGARAGTTGTAAATNRTLVSALQSRNQEATLDFRQGNSAPYTSGWQDVNPYGGLIQQHGSDFYAGPNPGQPWTQAALNTTTNPNANATWTTPAPADVVLLHIGTNAINTTGSSSDTALLEFRDLLVQLQADQNAGRIAPQADIFVARIIPKAASSTGSTGFDANTIRETAEYNAGLASILNAQVSGTPLFTTAFRQRLTFVDMFAVAANARLAASVSTPLSQLDPNGDGYVDWLTGGYNPATASGSIGGVNTTLWGASDFIHPAAAGYDIMAHQWFAAMQDRGLFNRRVIPEPTTASLLLAFASLNRRRSGRQTSSARQSRHAASPEV